MQAQRAGFGISIRALLAALAMTACAGSAAPTTDSVEVSGAVGELRFNEVQYVGTHNSYHIAPWPELGRLAMERGYAEDSEWTARRLMIALDFTHPALTEQLNMGLRQFEIDVHADPKGGKFQNPGHLDVLRRATGRPFDDFDPTRRLSEPGFKVFHGGLDMRSRCFLLRDCLAELKKWSDAHPRHFPIVIHIEAKDGAKAPLDSSYSNPGEPPFTSSDWSALENEIVAVLGADRIVTPGEVQGSAKDMATAIKRVGWPKLDQMAGRFVLLLLNKKEQTESYLRAEGQLSHRLFFTSQAIDSKSAAWFRIPDPAYPKLGVLINKRRLVTVQADTHTYEARTGKGVRRDTAFASGAQFILTDFPARDPRFTDYAVQFPGGRYVRCNVRTLKSACPI